MRGSDEKIIKITFIFSLLAHCLFLGMPGFNLNKSQPKKPEEIPVQIEIEKLPPLLPKIDVMGEKKKLKEVEQEQKEPKPESKPRPKKEKIAEEPEPKEQIEEVALKQEIIEKPESKEIKETVKVENPQEEAMFRYQDIIKQKIESCRRYPNWAKKQGFEGIAYLTFTVLSNGNTRDIKIVRSSGFDMLDNEAVSTVTRANPFPPIPKNLSRSYLKMEVAVVFRLK